jgi:probable addiction module antidote protein
LLALSYVIEAKGYTIPQLADEVGLTKQGLYKLLSDGGNPRLSTLNQVLESIGMKIRIEVE